MLQSLVVIVLLSFIVFIVLNLSGDPVRLLLPADATPEQVEQFRHELGFDRPLMFRYLTFLSRMAVLDFGASTKTGEPALEVVMSRMPATLQFAAVALVLALLVGIPLGIMAAVRRGTAIDSLAVVISLAGQSFPIFWVGLMMVLIFSVTLRWLPPAGIGGIRYLILPAVTIAVFLIAGITRVVRTSMLEVLHRQYLQTARAKGLSRTLIIVKHALRNAAIPIVTQIGLQFRYVVGGSVITETIFAWPGLGRVMVNAVASRDYPVVEAGVFVFAVLLIVVNLLVDILYTYINPRIRLS